MPPKYDVMIRPNATITSHPLLGAFLDHSNASQSYPPLPFHEMLKLHNASIARAILDEHDQILFFASFLCCDKIPTQPMTNPLLT
jgi:hypothetical protein